MKSIKLYITLIFSLVYITSYAQNTCNITGSIDNLSQRNKEELTKLYLQKVDLNGPTNTVDSCNIVNGKFNFTINLKTNQPQLYLISNFDNGSILFWAEPGNINIFLKDAAFPANAKVIGTPNNDLLNQSKEIENSVINEQLVAIDSLKKQHGEQWIDSAEGIEARKSIGAKALTNMYLKLTNLVLDNLDKDFAPFYMDVRLLNFLSENINKRIFNSMSPKLYNSPYYKNYQEDLFSKYLKVGSTVPNIELTTNKGNKIKLENFKGKYILLDFWASWCGPCRREIPVIQKLYNQTRDISDKFVIISVSLDDKKQNWENAIAKFDIDKEGWIQTCNLDGWNTKIAKLLGVTSIPRILLLNPSNQIIFLNLEGEEMIDKVKNAIESRKYE